MRPSQNRYRRPQPALRQAAMQSNQRNEKQPPAEPHWILTPMPGSRRLLHTPVRDFSSQKVQVRRQNLESYRAGG